MGATREPASTKRTRGRRALVSAVALVMPLAVFGFVPRASAPAPPTPAQRVQAVATPSIVYVGVRWRGWVLMPSAVRVDGTLSSRGWQGPFTVDTACSGFVADATGYVVTAGHCVDDRSMTYGGKAVIIDALIQEIHAAFPQITPDQLEIIRSATEENGRVEDRPGASPPQRTVTVDLAGGAAVSGLVASTVDYRGLTEGDVALLKVNAQTPLPTLAVASTSPAVGTPILLAGYVGSMGQIVDAGQEPSFKDGETSSQQTIGGVPFTEVSAEAGAGMSGGPALDMDGRVTGTVSFRPGNETAAFNFVTGTSTIRSLLTRNGVANRLTSADRAYRDGLDAYFAGRYHDAVASFDDALAGQPDNTSAQHYRQLAVENYGNDVGSSAGSTTLYLAVGVGAAVLLLTVALVLLRRRMGGPPPVAEEPAAAPAPMPTAPLEPTEPARTAPAEAAAPTEPAGYCPNCGTPHDAQAHFCEVCGTSVRVPASV